MSRRQGRYERRVAKREAKRRERSLALGDLDDIFAYHKLHKRGKQCCNGSRWKQSTQRHELHLFSGTAKRRKKILQGKYRWNKYAHFPLTERGKRREIDAPHVNDRQVHKVISQDILIPLYKDIIHDNGASLKDKGLSFSRRRLEEALRHHFKLYGMTGYVIVADMTGYFPNADREIIIARHHRLIYQVNVALLLDSLIRSFPGEIGVCLGVEPSQLEMIALPSPLDNYMTCQLGLQDYGHYMDDFVMCVPPHLDPKEVLRIFIDKAAEQGLTVSIKKTKIIPFGKPFRFCKAKYTVSETGHVSSHGSRDTIKRGRAKMNSFKSLVLDEHTMSFEDLWASVNGVLNYYEHFDDHGRVLRFKRIIYKIFDGLTCNGVKDFRNKEAEYAVYRS